MIKKVSEEFVKGKNDIGYVESSFTSEFGNEEILSSGSILKFQKLSRDMKDSEIINELKIKECTMSDVLATIKNATEDMKDGYANIFYIKGHSRVVGVGWGGSYWSVGGWRRDDDRWGEGGRVFSPATDSVESIADSLLLAIKICKENGLEVIKRM